MALAVGKGSFSRDGKIQDLGVEDVFLHVGEFEETLPTFLAEMKDAGSRLALSYIDCDLYESVNTVLHYIGPLLVPGSVLIFDDFYNFANWAAHSYRALEEFKVEIHQNRGYTIVPIGITVLGHAVAFRVERNK